ncbi:peptidoglycan DD-metalloendopeptidase family protein [Parasphingorhabdus sp. JC815]|uniref:murein hydrolase activator EnvC family protein n=1 Tax=Parasphingorhabdus sp. JC815 TaxID=3232140 RepID=UPI003457B1D1
MIRGLLVLTCLAAIGAVSAVALSAQTPGGSLSKEQSALLSAREQSELAQQRSNALRRQAQAATNDKDKSRLEAAAMAARIEAAEADIRAAQSRIAIVMGLQEQQRARLARKQGPVVRLTAALQMMTRKPTALALVEPRSLDELIYIRSIMATVIPEIERRTASLRNEVRQGEKLRMQSAKAMVSLDESQRRLTQRRNQLAHLKAGGQIDLPQFYAGVGQDHALALGEEARDMLDLMGQIRESGAVRESLAKLDGPMLNPKHDGALPIRSGPKHKSSTHAYRLPVAGDIVTGLGEISDSGYRSRGLTIAAGPNVPLVAPAAGRIAFAGSYGSYNNILIIEHDGGWTSLITNLAVIDVAVGDKVEQGDTLGHTGRANSSITLELRRHGRPIDIAALVGWG